MASVRRLLPSDLQPPPWYASLLNSARGLAFVNMLSFRKSCNETRRPFYMLIECHPQ